MVNNEVNTKNVILSAEQVEQLDVFKQRLTVLESEINNSQKVLNGLKSETDRAVKEKSYQDDLLKTIIEQVESKKQELVHIETEIEENKLNLSKIELDFKDKATFIKEKNEELDSRESSLQEEEETLEENKVLFNNQVDLFLKEKSAFDLKVKKLKEVIENI